MKKIYIYFLHTIVLIFYILLTLPVKASNLKVTLLTKIQELHSSTPTQTARDSDIQAPDKGEEKVLNDVKVYPNPVSNQLNLTYRITKDTNLTIKIMDVLGNEVAILFSKQVPTGEQMHTFSTPANLNSGGIYFVQILAGEETIVKRIYVM